MREAELKTKVMAWLAKQPATYAIKNWGGPMAGAGRADITMCVGGLYASIELKVGNNTPTHLQLATGRKVQKAGGRFAVAWSLDEVKEVWGELFQLAANLGLLTALEGKSEA